MTSALQTLRNCRIASFVQEGAEQFYSLFFLYLRMVSTVTIKECPVIGLADRRIRKGVEGNGLTEDIIRATGGPG
jgi:hypothetical protein